jgi:hypothetical protein
LHLEFRNLIEEDAVVTQAKQSGLSEVILTYWKQLKPSAIAALTAIYQLSNGRYCDAYQDELIATAGVGIRTFRNAVTLLEQLEIIAIERYYSALERKTKNRYLLLHVDQPASMLADYPPPQPADMFADYPDQPANMLAAMMHDDEDIDNEILEKRKTVLGLLDFLHDGERRKRAKQKHVTIAYAQAWRAWWERKEFGELTNPAGFANKNISQGHAPPGPQMPLPAGQLFGEELVPNGLVAEMDGQALTAVGLTLEDIQAWHATLSQLQLQMTRATFDSHLHNSTPLRREGEVLVIGIWCEQSREWVDKRLREPIGRAAATNGLTQLHFEVPVTARSLVSVDSS